MPDHPKPATSLVLRVRGKVQGVGYRAAAQAEALRLGLQGWVRNRADGSVEALIAGNEEAVERFVEWSRCGPPAARVAEVACSPAAEEAPAGPFGVRPTH
ncbi:acylphosphatase [Azoarcus sp. TTM-91]|uniref:acylphosphatase n=1 Tax=Azoarcus sp. TTM-91 TaxID=2691581 RepID=UPI00145F4556|nr:acylphosphatase [Azoarcus sp. TTM-91]NMG32990.1 acylphosphatase [Azoarcus sp. TTM-91]